MMKMNINIQLIASLTIRPSFKKSIYEYKNLEIIEIKGEDDNAKK